MTDIEMRALASYIEATRWYGLMGALLMYCLYVIAVTAYYQATGIMRDVFWPGLFTAGSVIAYFAGGWAIRFLRK